jgi:hypothetical protein
MPSSKPVLGVNDLQSQYPEIAKEWHPLRNGDLKPTEVRRGSGNPMLISTVSAPSATAFIAASARKSGRQSNN